MNLSTDHLERHETLKNYFSAKLKIFNYAKHKVINNNLKNSEKHITFDIKNKSIYINSSPIDNLFFENYNFVLYKDKKYYFDTYSHIIIVSHSKLITHLLDFPICFLPKY